MLFLYSLFLTIHDLFKYNIKRYALLNGLFWIVIWGIIAFIYWNKMYLFTSDIISFFPFAFIKISGAYIIYTLLWIQFIFMTIGIFYVFLNDLIESEISHEKFKYVTIIVALISIIFWSIIFILKKDFIISYITHILKILPFQTVEELLAIFLAILFFYLLYCVSLSISFLFIFIPKLIDIAIEEYPQISYNDISYKDLFLIVFRDLIIYIILAIILYPFMLIPFINIIILMFLWAYMVKDSYYKTVHILFNVELTKKEKWILAIMSTFLNFLPIINIFAPIFGILQFFHYGIEKKLQEKI